MESRRSAYQVGKHDESTRMAQKKGLPSLLETEGLLQECCECSPKQRAVSGEAFAQRPQCRFPASAAMRAPEPEEW